MEKEKRSSRLQEKEASFSKKKDRCSNSFDSLNTRTKATAKGDSSGRGIFRVATLGGLLLLQGVLLGRELG